MGSSKWGVGLAQSSLVLADTVEYLNSWGIGASPVARTKGLEEQEDGGQEGLESLLSSSSTQSRRLDAAGSFRKYG